MDFIDDIKQLSTEIVEKIKDASDYSSTKDIYNEANTRKALVEPFIKCLGYDVTDPLEVFSEATADSGSNKGKKADYSIFKEDVAIILIECKPLGTPLDEKCRSQLVGYFQNTPEVRFAILTDGCRYLFYGDKGGQNIMDDEPSLTFDIRHYDQTQVNMLEKFRKDVFDVVTTTESAENHRYRNKIKERLKELIKSPTLEFCKLLAKDLYSGYFKEKTFRPLVEKVLTNFFDDEVDKSLATLTLRRRDEPTETEQPEEAPEEEDDVILTTEKEIQGHLIIRAILAGIVDTECVTMRDYSGVGNCAILYEDNAQKPICHFRFKGKNMDIILFDEENNKIKHQIGGLTDLYGFSSELIETVKRYLPEK